MKVLVNGIGNIGQTLLSILIDYKNLLEIEEVYALKNTAIQSWNVEEIKLLQEKGVKVCTKINDSFIDLDTVIDYIDYIFDCNANSFGLKNKDWYASLPNLKGCSAQGSEKGFGMSYMSGVNDVQIANEKFVHIVSCNTHAISSLLLSFCNQDISNLEDADFVVVRRSEDIGQHQRLVSANVISRHLSDEKGTHHAIDVIDLFMTKDEKLNLQSSDITTPSQLMHSVRFNIGLKNVPNPEEIQTYISNVSSVSTTAKFDSNIVFELGRRYSPYGRLFSHAIINDNNILYQSEEKRVLGWAMIPQEGNTILSTINAYLLRLDLESDIKMDIIRKDLIRKSW